MEEMIKVVIKRPYQEPEITTIKNSLYSLYENIECKTIEMQHLPDIRGVVMSMDEDGKFKQLAGNFFVPSFADCIVGTCVFSSCDEDGELASLSDKQIKEIQKYIKHFGLVEGEDLYGDDKLYLIARAIKRYDRYYKNEGEL